MKKENKVVDTNQQKQKGGYGILSLMAMIVGIVIGSGIFAKNASLIGTAGSVGIVLLSWVLGSLIVVSLVIAFLEIISITEIAGEQSTLANWGRRLVGVKFGKMLGVYFALAYFPIIMAGLFTVGSESLLHSISYLVTPDHTDSWYLELTSDSFNYAASITAVAFVLLLIIMSINAISNKPGKYFQNIGTMVKTIPLFFIVALFIFMLSTNISEIHFATTDELGTESGREFTVLFKAVMATVPAVLFSFDGFLIAGSLSKEAKKPSTFRIAFIISIIFIIVIYVLYSLSILGLGTVDDSHGPYGSVSNAIYNVFEDPTTAAIIDSTVVSIITISILTGVSGCSIATYRMMADMSVNNFIADKDGEILKKNKAGVNVNGAIIIIGATSFWFFTGVIFDSIALVPGEGYFGAYNNQVTLFGLDMVVIWAYFIYVVVIFGAVINRFTHKNLVHKRSLFWPASILAIVLTTIVTISFAEMVLLPGDAGMSDKIWQAKIIYTIVFFSYIIVLYIFLGLRTGKITGAIEVPEKIQAKADQGNEKAIALVERIHNKNKMAAEYYGITLEEYEYNRQEIIEKINKEKEARKIMLEEKHNNIDSKKEKKIKEEPRPTEDVDASVKKVAPKAKNK